MNRKNHMKVNSGFIQPEFHLIWCLSSLLCLIIVLELCNLPFWKLGPSSALLFLIAWLYIFVLDLHQKYSIRKVCHCSKAFTTKSFINCSNIFLSLPKTASKNICVSICLLFRWDQAGPNKLIFDWSLCQAVEISPHMCTKPLGWESHSYERQLNRKVEKKAQGKYYYARSSM